MHSILYKLLFISCISIVLFHHVHSFEGEDGSSFIWENNPLTVNIRINVALMGFDGNGAHGFKVDPDRLEKHLKDTLPYRDPHCLETGEQIYVRFYIDYNVKSLPIDEYIKIIQRTKVADTTSQTSKPSYTVPIGQDLDTYFNNLHSQFASNSPAGEYTIFIMNPDIKDFQYFLKYENSPCSTQQWIGSHRYLVVDLVSGPQSYGGRETDQGIITGYSLGTTPSKTSPTMAALSTVILSAIRTTFVPDIEFEAIQHADKILIPIVILRNHHLWNALDPNTDLSIDTETIAKQVKKMFLPSQEIIFVAETHSLHEHRHLSMAVSKARKANIAHELEERGKFVAKNKPYLDSDVLIHEFKKVEDLLGSGLISLSTMHKSAFYADLPQESQGTHVLPVYVLSMAGLEPGTTLAQGSLVHATKEAVVVLQTNESAVPTMFFHYRDRKLYQDARDPTRHILAGITKAVGGVVEPYRGWSEIHNKVVTDYRWAMGEHPFGVFTNNSHLSQIFYDTILRNVILSRINVALTIIQDTMIELDQFAKDFLYNPYLEGVNHTDYAEWSNWLDQLYHQPMPDTMSPIAGETVTQIHQEVKQLQEQVVNIGKLLVNYKFEEAYSLTSSLELAAKTFKQYAINEIDDSESKLLCCYLKHDVEEPASSHIGNLILVLLTFLFAFGTISFIIRRGQKPK